MAQQPNGPNGPHHHQQHHHNMTTPNTTSNNLLSPIADITIRIVESLLAAHNEPNTPRRVRSVHRSTPQHRHHNGDMRPLTSSRSEYVQSRTEKNIFSAQSNLSISARQQIEAQYGLLKFVPLTTFAQFNGLVFKNRAVVYFDYTQSQQTTYLVNLFCARYENIGPHVSTRPSFYFVTANDFSPLLGVIQSTVNEISDTQDLIDIPTTYFGSEEEEETLDYFGALAHPPFIFSTMPERFFEVLFKQFKEDGHMRVFFVDLTIMRVFEYINLPPVTQIQRKNLPLIREEVESSADQTTSVGVSLKRARSVGSKLESIEYKKVKETKDEPTCVDLLFDLFSQQRIFQFDLVTNLESKNSDNKRHEFALFETSIRTGMPIFENKVTYPPPPPQKQQQQQQQYEEEDQFFKQSVVWRSDSSSEPTRFLLTRKGMLIETIWYSKSIFKFIVSRMSDNFQTAISNAGGGGLKTVFIRKNRHALSNILAHSMFKHWPQVTYQQFLEDRTTTIQPPQITNGVQTDRILFINNTASQCISQNRDIFSILDFSQSTAVPSYLGFVARFPIGQNQQNCCCVYADKLYVFTAQFDSILCAIMNTFPAIVLATPDKVCVSTAAAAATTSAVSAASTTTPTTALTLYGHLLTSFCDIQAIDTLDELRRMLFSAQLTIQLSSSSPTTSSLALQEDSAAAAAAAAAAASIQTPAQFKWLVTEDARNRLLARNMEHLSNVLVEPEKTESSEHICCPVCATEQNLVLILPCRHVICLDCFGKLEKTTIDQQQQPPCPTCRQSTVFICKIFS